MKVTQLISRVKLKEIRKDNFGCLHIDFVDHNNEHFETHTFEETQWPSNYITWATEYESSFGYIKKIINLEEV